MFRLLALGVLALVLPARTVAEPFAYVVITNRTVAVIDTATDMVLNCLTCPIPVGDLAIGIAFDPQNLHAYVTNTDDNTVSVIDTITNTIVGDPIPVGRGPSYIAIRPDGTRAYASNTDEHTVSVIDTRRIRSWTRPSRSV